MAWFADNSPCTYFGDRWTPYLRAIGWLERDQIFITGTSAVMALHKLIHFAREPFQPVVACGFHECDLCDESEFRGCANIWIPGNRFLYVCPALIVHYIREHHYAPPDDFCEAVIRCPTMNSPEYHAAYLSNGGRFLVPPDVSGSSVLL